MIFGPILYFGSPRELVINGEHWRKGPRGLTNFDPIQLPIYEEAVRRYEEKTGDKTLEIKLSPIYPYRQCENGYYSLWTNKFMDRGPFWKVFEEVKAEHD